MSDSIQPGSPAPRAVFFDEEHARTVVTRIRRDGYRAELSRERLAGEDDDDDQPWVVLADAPLLVLEMYVDEYDGWLDIDESDPAKPVELPPALPLPTEPRRIKRQKD